MSIFSEIIININATVSSSESVLEDKQKVCSKLHRKYKWDRISINEN